MKIIRFESVSSKIVTKLIVSLVNTQTNLNHQKEKSID